MRIRTLWSTSGRSTGRSTTGSVSKSAGSQEHTPRILPAWLIIWECMSQKMIRKRDTAMPNSRPWERRSMHSLRKKVARQLLRLREWIRRRDVSIPHSTLSAIFWIQFLWHFILRNRKFWTCAHHSLKAVIEWKNGENKSLTSYAPDWWSRLTYLMTPWGLLKVLRKNNLEYSVLKTKWLKGEEKLQVLKDHLKKWPIILLIWNWQTKKKLFVRKRAMTHRHYVTLRWYNDKERVFYVYDSNTKRKTEQYILKMLVFLFHIIIIFIQNLIYLEIDFKNKLEVN